MEQEQAIDFKGEFPTLERIREVSASWGRIPGYVRMFGPGYASVILNRPKEEFAYLRSLPNDELVHRWEEIIEQVPQVDPSVLADDFRSRGIVRMCLHGVQPVDGHEWDVRKSNDYLAQTVSSAPEFLFGFGVVDVGDIRTAISEVVRCHESLDFRGLKLTPIFSGMAADDSALDPVFAKCEELGMMVWLHCGTNWNSSLRMDLSHPRRVDAVATRFPRLKLVAGHAGWPWVLDAVTTAWRHENVFLDLSAHRPKYMAAAGSGWEPLLHFGNSVISSKILFASAWDLLGLHPSEVASEIEALPLRSSVKRLWLLENARDLMSRD